MLVQKASRSGQRYYSCVSLVVWWKQEGRLRQLLDWVKSKSIRSKLKAPPSFEKTDPVEVAIPVTCSQASSSSSLESTKCGYFTCFKSNDEEERASSPQPSLESPSKFSTLLTSRSPTVQVSLPFVTARTATGIVSHRVVRGLSMNAPVGSDDALLASCRAFIPSLTNAMHKGQAGRIAVIGGSEEYTGAPYFAAISALKVGADLAHVFCTKSAAPVIKMYSPELIVHPILDTDTAMESFMEYAARMHCFVIGPGLGRDPKILLTVSKMIEKLKDMEKPLVIDADALFLINKELDLIRNYPKVILTPNSVEFSRLYAAVLGEEVKPVPSASSEKVRELANALGHVTILHKGATDVASNGRLTVCCAGGGSNRRCGGQGDLLAGAMAVLFHWALAYGDRGGAPAPPELLAVYGACRLTRECARLAFSQNGRSTTTSDLIRLIHQAFSFLFGP